jgi:hypothetical protein
VTFSGDFDLARSEPVLDYAPDDALESQVESHPSIYRRQGLYLGLIDNVVESFIVYEPNGNPRLISYGEFERNFYESDLKRPFNNIAYLFHNFHPKYRPVLWRILLTQVHIYHAIKNTRELKDSKSSVLFKTLKITPEQERSIYDWRLKDGASEIYEEVYIYPFNAVENYLRIKLGEFFK